jgi:HAD superfamily hydrolase (TIGR01509 family)
VTALPTARGRRVLAGFDLVIFDCDGVLVDSETIACQCLSELLTERGLKTSAADVFERYLGASLRTVAAEFVHATGRPLPKGFRTELWTRLASSLSVSLRQTPGIDSVLRALTTPFCLVSSSDPARINLSLKITGLTPFFAGRIFDSSMVAQGKPAPDLFLLAARKMRAAPSRTLVIEDSVNGVRGAKAAGMTVWGFLGGSHHLHLNGVTQLTDAGADRLFRSMTAFFTTTAEAG